MARNGSGTFNLVVNSWNPATNGNSATAADWQALINDVASALTQSLSADGQTALTGNLVANNNKITGLAAGTATGDSLRFQQLFSQGQPTDIASAATLDIGSVNSTLLNVTGTTTITSFGVNYNGPRFLRFDGILTLTHGASLVLPGSANITTAAGDSAIAVPFGSPTTGWRVVAYQKANAAALLLASDAETQAGTDAVKSVTSAGLASVTATETRRGLVELATIAEAQTGTDTQRAVTPAGVAALALGVGQSWIDVTGSRVAGTTYTNTTGKPIFVSIYTGGQGSGAFVQITVNSTFVAGVQNNTATLLPSSIGAIVPPSNTYEVVVGAGGAVGTWSELR